ncbi:MAG: MotA/TolQ/ExbB proton channel family protein [Sedimentisphaerales bacterium]|nr:MotA/TolQ/ExbB proton channel family protein [Sedimentisphaerales bacterium]
MALNESLIELFSRGGPVMYGIAGVSLVAWFLSLRTWLLAGTLLKRLQKMTHGRMGITHPSLNSFALTTQTVRLGRGLSLVGTLAAVLPLLGLLGTVLGMLLSFEVIQVYGTSQPRLLAGGIGQALITTQAGLWTAVPVFFFHHIIHRRVRLIRNETDVFFHVMQTTNGSPMPEIRRTRRAGEH